MLLGMLFTLTTAMATSKTSLKVLYVGGSADVETFGMVDVDKLPLESDRAFYYRTYGLIYVDIEAIEKALAFYRRVKAYQDIKDCEGYIQTIRNMQTQ